MDPSSRLFSHSKQNRCFIFMFVSTFVSRFSALNLVVWSLKTIIWWNRFGKALIADRCRILFDFELIFSCLFAALGLIFMTFGVLEAGLKFDDFHGYPGGNQVLSIQSISANLVAGWLPNQQLSILTQAEKPYVLRLKSNTYPG